MAKFFYIIGLLACSFFVLGKDTGKVDFATTQVAPGLYMLSGVNGFTGGNIVLSVGEDGVIMIDDSMPPFLDKLKNAVKQVAGKEVDFLINTHVHGDHIGNNEALGKSGAHIVAHENLRTHLLKKGIRSKAGKKEAPKAALPVITFSHNMNFYLNGQDARLIHLADAHTDGDAIVYYPHANVIHTGDLMFNGMFPYIDSSSGGSLDGYIKAQEKILSLADNKTKIIPGHGPLAKKQDLKDSLAMLKDAKKLVAALKKQGKSEEQLVKLNPIARYHQRWNWSFITTEKMTRQIYQGIK